MQWPRRSQPSSSESRSVLPAPTRGPMEPLLPSLRALFFPLAPAFSLTDIPLLHSRRTEGLLSPSLENGEFQFPAQAPAAAEGDASKAVEQVVTPWDVQGATVDGVQVSGGSAEKAKKD